MSIQSSLIKLANLFVKEVKENLDSSEYPSGADRAGRDYSPIEETIEVGNPLLKSRGGEIKIVIGSEKAPYTKMYEFGKGAYDIISDNDMVFAKEYWPQYKPPPPAPLFFVFGQVRHPEFAGKPYIKPVVDSFDLQARKVITKDEVRKLIFGDKPRREVWT